MRQIGKRQNHVIGQYWRSIKLRNNSLALVNTIYTLVFKS